MARGLHFQRGSVFHAGSSPLLTEFQNCTIVRFAQSEGELRRQIDTTVCGGAGRIGKSHNIIGNAEES
jgi:hypothetical protein